jgi:hypothetical protein
MLSKPAKLALACLTYLALAFLVAVLAKRLVGR